VPNLLSEHKVPLALVEQRGATGELCIRPAKVAGGTPEVWSR
jgi:hypothetical protein